MAIWSGSNTGLGDYIHWRKINYINYGTYRIYGRGDNAIQAATTAYQNLKTLIRSKVSMQSSTTQIESYLNALLNQNYLGAASAASINIEQQEIADAEQTLIKYIEGNIEGSFNRLELDVNRPATLEFVKYKYSGLAKQNQTNISKSSLIQARQHTNTLINKINKLISKGTLSVQEIAALSQTQAELTSISNNLRQYEVQASANKGKKVAFATIGATGSRILNPLGEILVRLQQLENSFSVPNQKELGDIGEAFGVMAALVADEQVANITQQSLEKYIVGTSGRSKTIIETSKHFVNSAGLDQLDRHWIYDQNQGILTSKGGSQDTVDIEVPLQDTNNIFGTDLLRASIKNIGSNTKNLQQIRLIDSTTLLALMPVLETNFINHYLNIMTTNVERQDDWLVQGIRNNQIYDNTIKYALAARAISGVRNSNFTKLSQYLIIHNRSAHKFKVYQTTKLLDELSPSFGTFNDTMAKVTGIPFDYIENKFEPSGPEARIAKVLASAAQKKLSMSLMVK